MSRYTAVEAAEVLREFLKALPEPVIPWDHYESFVSILDGPDDQALHRAESALRGLEDASREVLLYMCDLIIMFAKHAPMTPWRPSGPEIPTNMTGLTGKH
jgi:hypothetical protein